MWDREKNSEDELDLVYKDTGARETMAPKQKDHQYLSKHTFIPVENYTATTANDPQNYNPGKRSAKTQPEPINQRDTITLEGSYGDFDQQLLKKFPIGANLLLSNKPYDALKLKRSFLSEKSNNLENLKTRKPKRPLNNQEKQNLKRAPLIFLKDRFKGPAHTIDPKTGLHLEQVARNLGTIARKIKNPGKVDAQFKIIENRSIKNYSPNTALIKEDGKQPREIKHDDLAFIPGKEFTESIGRRH